MTTIEDVKRVYDEHIGFYNDLLINKDLDLNEDGKGWLFELLELVEGLVVENSRVEIVPGAPRRVHRPRSGVGRGGAEHACPWCGAVLPNLILSQHIHDWHDNKYVGMNQRTPTEKAKFKSTHYKYEITPETHPIAVREKLAAEALVNKVTKKRDDVIKADEIARKFNEKQKAALK